MEMNAIRKALMRRRDELMGVAVVREEAAQTVTLEEEADRQFERLDDEVLAALSAADREEITRIELALGKLDEGSYGECEECGRKISDKRLEAMPDALLCIDCATKAEARA